MEAGSVKLPAGEVEIIETPVMAHESGLATENDDDNTSQNADNVANVQQHGTGEPYLCVDEPRKVEAIVTLSSSSTLDDPVISPSCELTEVTAVQFNAPETLEAGCPVASEEATISGEEASVTDELLQEQPGSLFKQATNVEFDIGGQERSGSGIESNEEDKDSHEDGFGSKHQEDTGATHDKFGSPLVQGEQLGLSTAITDDVEKEDQESDGSGTELYEDVEDDLENVFGSMHQENTEGTYDERSSLLPQSEEKCLSTSPDGTNHEIMVERSIFELERRAPVEEEGTEETNGNLDLISAEDDAGWKSKQDTSEVIDDQMKGVLIDVLEVSQKDSNVLESDQDDSLEKQISFFRSESEANLSDATDLPPPVTGPVMATDEDTSNSLKVEEGPKTEFVAGQDSSVAGIPSGEVFVDLQEQYSDVTKTIGDVYERESYIEEALSKPLEIAAELGSEKVVVSEVPLSVEDCAEASEHVHADSDSNQFQEGECNTGIEEAPSVAVKQAISLEKEVDLVVHCNAGAPEVCQSSLEFLKADDSQTLEVGSLGGKSMDSQWCAEIQSHEDIFQSEVKLLSQTKNGATSSDQRFEQGFRHDKDGGSSLDSTAGSSWKLCETEPQTAFEDANSSGSEDSASSPAHTQPSPQQRKKRIDLSHQFVRKIVKIQHDREQYDREQSEKQSQAQQVAGLAHQGVKANVIQEQRNNLAEKRQVRKIPGNEFIYRRPNERGSDRYIKDLQPTHNTKGKRSVPAQAKSASTLLREPIHEGNLQGQVTFSEAEGPLEGNQPGKIGRSKHDRFMPIYRPPSARESFAASLDEQNSMAESEFPYCSFIVNSSPDSSTSSVLESPVPSMGVTKVGEDKGMLTVVKSSSGERYVHYVESQEQQTTLKGMSIKVTFDTEKQQRHIEFSDVERARQQKQIEKMSPVSSDFNHGLDCSPGFDLSRSPDMNSVLSHSPHTPSSFPLGGSPVLSQGKVRSGGIPSSAKGKFTQQTERGTPSWTPFHVAHDDVSPSIPFQLQLDKRAHRKFEGKHGFSEQADIPVKLQEPYSWMPEASPAPMHLSTGGTSHSTYGGKMRRAAQSNREVRMQNSSLQIPTVGHSWSIPHRRERPTDGDKEFINQRMTPQIPQFDLPFAEMMSSDAKGKQKTAAATDRSKDKRQSKYKNMVKDYTLPFTAQVEGSNPSTFMVSSQSHLASGISQTELEAKGEKHHKVPSLYDVNQRNSQESIESGRGLRSDNTRKGSTQNSKPQLSPLSVEGSTQHTACLLGKWGDIVDDSPDAYDYLQMTVKGDMAEGAEGPESRARTYNYGSATNSDFSDVANSKNEKVMSKGSSKYRGMRNNGFGDNDGQQKNKEAGEVVQTGFGHPVNENRVRRSVWERLGPQNASGPSILGPPPRILEDRDVEKASSDAFSGKTSEANRIFDFGVHGSALDLHGLRLSSVSHDSPYNLELDAFRNDECTEVVVQAYKDSAQKRSKRELYVPRRGL